MRRVRVCWRIRGHLQNWRRLGPLAATTSQAWRVLVLALGRLRRRRGLVPTNSGIIVAFVGPKASGKSTLTTGLLATAYVLGLGAVLLGLWRPPARAWSWRGVLLLGAAALLTGPLGSADHTNYAAYGRIAALGGDPYLVAPEDFAGGTDPVASAVEPPWTETVSVYGRVAAGLNKPIGSYSDTVVATVTF